MNNVLIVTYYWPPSGGAGVQRWLKFSKYLPEFGWKPVILTVDPDYATYPAIDPTLGNNLPENIEVHRTKATDWFRLYNSDKSKIPSSGFADYKNASLKGKITRFLRGNLFIPDPRRGWNKFAFRKACDLIEKYNITRIITTSPPHSTQLIGLKVRKKYPGIKWISDLRDPWTDIYYYDQFYPTFVSRFIDGCYEKRVLRKADTIITVGPSLKKTFSSKAKGISNKIEVITNGYDEMDFKEAATSDPIRFTITYVGTLSEQYPISGFLKVLSLLKKSEPGFILRFVGKVPQNIADEIRAEISPEYVDFIPYTNHDEAVRLMIHSSMLLLVIPDHSNNENIVTGKIFEYIASGKPILCLGPKNGDAAAILRQYNYGECYSYEDLINIEKFIVSVILNSSGRQPRSDEFSHRNIVKKLVTFLG